MMDSKLHLPSLKKSTSPGMGKIFEKTGQFQTIPASSHYSGQKVAVNFKKNKLP